MSGANAVQTRFPNVGINESAYVDEPVQIGEGTRIWHFCHILGDVTIGRDCSIGQNVMIGPRVTVGNNCKIQNNVSIYEGVTLEDDVFCGPSCVFTNVFNHNQLADPGQTWLTDPADFGSLETGGGGFQVNNPRKIEIAVRLKF